MNPLFNAFLFVAMLFNFSFAAWSPITSDAVFLSAVNNPKTKSNATFVFLYKADVRCPYQNKETAVSKVKT